MPGALSSYALALLFFSRRLLRFGRLDFREFAARLLVCLGADRAGDMESGPGEKIGRYSTAGGMVRYRDNGPVFRNPCEVLSQLARLNTQIHGKPAIGADFVRTADID